jgi:nucleoside 2-deoxyribosyltransferase
MVNSPTVDVTPSREESLDAYRAGRLRESSHVFKLQHMATCFVIQPFDSGPFDKRYEDVFVPAIEASGLEPYRVDRDPSVEIPIEEIEQGIRKSEACLADISLPNPNVWFELGYAIAASKPVILVCAHDPTRRFPFDVQHRSIIIYKTESARDFADLKSAIEDKLKALLAKEDKLEQIAASSPLAQREGLSQHEIMALVTIAENANGPEGEVGTWTIRQDMERNGYTRLAVALALTTLGQKTLVSVRRDIDQDGEPNAFYTVTSYGMKWLLDNQDMLVLRREKPTHRIRKDEDLPF